MLRIGIVDDHKLFRKSLSLLINSFDGMEVVLDADNGKVFLEKLADTPIDIVLLDIQMPEMNGFETCKILHLQYPEILILIVSQLTSKESIHKIMEIGAHGYFTKNSDPNLLESAIRSLEEKGFFFEMEFGSVMREALRWQSDEIPKGEDLPEMILSDRELQIIKMTAGELNSTEIGEILCITKRTVEGHKVRILEKTNSKNFIGVVLYALRHGILMIEEL
ncbi:response regulator [Flavobacterium sp. 3HN19-14]|uniref:response regulator n=1 Tax=Flavobacterium sp. 3HN19-14 TaxID=3448133 RepID=UPI003EE1DDDD